MMTAEEARKLSNANITTFDGIIELIKEKAKKGGRSVDVFYLEKEVSLKLTELGYNIDFFPERRGLCLTISW